MQNLEKQIANIEKNFLQALKKVKTIDGLETVRITFLGRNGRISQLMPQLKKLSVEKKRTIGPLINKLKEKTEEHYNRKKKEFFEAHIAQELEKEKYFDVTSYIPGEIKGSIHPITQVLEHIENIFISMGFSVADGPEVETDYYNFESLNIPQDHPARDMWDTLWLDVPGMLLRTHTSTVQIHAMETYELPLALISPGRVFRHEATDATHDFMFNQVEGLVIDKTISLAHLLGTVKVFFRALYEKEDLDIRVRPSYFPFVEPGVEIDITCPFCTKGCSVCKYTQWMEVGGAGLVHPNVLNFSGIDAQQYSGFAFGFGLDRLTMLKYNINDIRLLPSGKVDFLEQF